MTDIEFLPFEYKIMPLVLTILGVLVSYYVYVFRIHDFFVLKQSKNVIKIFNFFNKKWYFDRMYNELIVQNVLKKSYYFFYQDIDRGIIEKFGPVGITNVLYSGSSFLSKIQTGYVIHYITYFVFSIIFFILISIYNFPFLIIFLFVAFFSTYYLEKNVMTFAKKS